MKVCFLDLVKDCPRIKPFKQTFFTHIYKAQRRLRPLPLAACPLHKERELTELEGSDVDVVFKNIGILNKGADLPRILGRNSAQKKLVFIFICSETDC